MAAEGARLYTGKNKVTQLMVGIVCAAMYGAGLWATGFLPTIPGITWVRPANILSEIFGASFGWTGSLAVMFGNSLGDLMSSRFNPTTLWWLLPLELVCTALVVYWGVTDPSLRSLRGKIEWAIWAVVGQGLLTGFGIAFFVTYIQAMAPREAFTTIGWTITLNEGIPAIFGGVVQYFLFPAIVRTGLWWGRNLEKSNVPKSYLAELMR